MKKSLLFLSFALLSSSLTYAQFGIKAGVNIASITEENQNTTRDDIENNSIVAPVFGLTYAINLGDVLTIQPELLYAQSGGRNTYSALGSNIESTYRINYFEVPVLAKLQLGNESGDGIGFHLAAGPWLGYAINGKSKVVTTIAGVDATSERDFTFDDQDDAKRVNYGLIGAAGVSFGKIEFDLRYNFGINNLLDNDASNTNDNKNVLQTRGIALTLGYKF